MKTLPCRYCGNKLEWDSENGRYVQEGGFLNTTAEESRDMAGQCGLSEDGRHRPRRPNLNPILDMSRDGDWGDPYGTAMSWAYASAEVLYDADPNEVPTELEYRPSIAGPEIPNGSAEPHRIRLTDLSFETVSVWTWLHNVDSDWDGDPEDLPYWEDPEFKVRAEELRQACLLWHRYINWCRLAGKDY